MELFRGSMTRHSAVIHRDDDPARVRRAGLDDDWAEAVPIRVPNTITVEERLPPGFAAVLINRAHTYPDLILPITETERRVVAAIDGRRTVAATAAAGGLDVATHHDELRDLLTRLYRYDQIGFVAAKRGK